MITVNDVPICLLCLRQSLGWLVVSFSKKKNQKQNKKKDVYIYIYIPYTYIHLYNILYVYMDTAAYGRSWLYAIYIVIKYSLKTN